MITAPDGATITDYLLRVSPGDTISLAPGGSYTLGAAETGFSSLRSGTSEHHTKVLGNGATITGGTVGISLTSKAFIDFSNLYLVDQTVNGVGLTGSDDITFTNIYPKSSVYGDSSDTWKIVNADRITINGGISGPSTTNYNPTDGVEFWGPCNDCAVNNHTVLGITGGATPDHHGFEVYAGDGDDICDNIVFTNCHAEGVDVGFSAEGGPADVAHTNIKAINCTTTSMDNYDVQGIDGSTFLVTADTLTSRNGSVTEL